MGNQPKTNILILVEHAGQGGAEKVAATLAESLAGQGVYEVYYCALYQPAALPHLPGVNVNSLGLSTGGGFRGRLKRYRGAVSRLSRFKKENNIYVTISNLWPTDWVNRLAGDEKKIAVIHTTILHSHHNWMMLKARRLVSFVYTGLHKVVVVSSNLVPELTDFFKIPASKIQVISNPVDNQRAALLATEAPAEALQKLFSQKRVLTAVGRLSHEKNTASLVRIFRLIKPTGAKLLYVGEGPEKAALQVQVLKAGLTLADLSEGYPKDEKDVYFAPFQQNVFPVFRNTSLLLFPSRGEGVPLVLLEAMSCGCPVLASDCPNGGVSEVMQGKTPFNIQQPRTKAEAATGGYLMPIPDDAATDALWAEKIEEMLSLGEEEWGKISRTAQERAADYDIHHFSREWHEMIQNTLNE